MPMTLNRVLTPAGPDAAPNMPGMNWQDLRCLTCDSRYCGYTCHMLPGTVYAPGQGWVSP